MTSGETLFSSTSLTRSIERLHGLGTGEVTEVLSSTLLDLRLEDDVEVMVTIDPQGSRIDLRSKTVLGEEILKEMDGLSQSYPCPSGMCQMSSAGNCMWCGRGV